MHMLDPTDWLMIAIAILTIFFIGRYLFMEPPTKKRRGVPYTAAHTHRHVAEGSPTSRYPTSKVHPGRRPGFLDELADEIGDGIQSIADRRRVAEEEEREQRVRERNSAVVMSALGALTVNETMRPERVQTGECRVEEPARNSQFGGESSGSPPGSDSSPSCNAD